MSWKLRDQRAQELRPLQRSIENGQTKREISLQPIVLTKLDSWARDLVCCPVSKGDLVWSRNAAYSPLSGLTYPFLEREKVWDFRVKRPSFVPNLAHRAWEDGQREYEVWQTKLNSADDLETYNREIDSVREIYVEEFTLSGRILDVGGHQGRLRHFLLPNVEYLSVDPFADVFLGLCNQPNLLQAYPSLARPCNFLCGHAELLPLRQHTFDYVHVRSCLDHFGDPFVAVCEARRVLKKAGGLLIGLRVGQPVTAKSAAVGQFLRRLQRKINSAGLWKTIQTVVARLSGTQRDAHIWHPTYQELICLLKVLRFEVEKTHWQKPPHDDVVYVMARKVEYEIEGSPPDDLA
jgi:SAM-dependent methyltransferase